MLARPWPARPPGSIAMLAIGLGLLPVPDPALGSHGGREVGRIYLSTSPDETKPHPGWPDRITPFQHFKFFVVIELDDTDLGHPKWNKGSGFIGWDASIRIPASVTVVGRFLHPPGATNLSAGNNWLVGLGVVVLANQTPFVAVEYRGIFLDEQVDVTLHVQEASPSPTNPPRPAFYELQRTEECALPNGEPWKCIRPFAEALGMIVNCDEQCPSRVTTESSDWSALKAAYRQNP